MSWLRILQLVPFQFIAISTKLQAQLVFVGNFERSRRETATAFVLVALATIFDFHQLSSSLFCLSLSLFSSFTRLSWTRGRRNYGIIKIFILLTLHAHRFMVELAHHPQRLCNELCLKWLIQWLHLMAVSRTTTTTTRNEDGGESFECNFFYASMGEVSGSSNFDDSFQDCFEVSH